MHISKSTLHGCFAVAMAIVAFIPLGHICTLANMTPYMVSYMYNRTHDVDYSMGIWLSVGLHSVQGVATPVTTVLLPILGFRPLLLGSALIHFLGILLTGWTLNISFGAVVFTYAIMVGWGIGASYGLLLSLAASWFPKHRGLIVGICACGFGAGAILLTPIQTAIINPDNVAVNNVTQMFEDKDLLDRVPKCLYIIGGILAGLQLIGCIFIRPKPEKKEQAPDDWSDACDSRTTKTTEKSEDTMESRSSTPEVEEINLSPMQILHTKEAYLLWSVMFFSLIPLTLITATVKVAGQKAIPDDEYLSLVITLGSAFNTIGRIAWGPVGDRFSYKVPLIINNFVYSAILMSLPVIPSIPVAGKYLYAIWVMCAYVCIGGNFVFVPFGVSRAFGHKFFAGNYGIVFTAFCPGGIISGLIVYFTHIEDHLTHIFIACGIISMMSSIAALFLMDKGAPACCQQRLCLRKRGRESTSQ